MSTLLKIIIAIFKFIKRKLGAVGILTIIILILLPVCASMYNDNADEYVYDVQWEVGAVNIEQVEKTADRSADFSEWELDEEYGEKYMYEVTLEVTNQGVNPIVVDREFNMIFVENEEGLIEDFEIYSYYYEMDIYDRMDTQVIAPGRTYPVRLLFLFEEDEIPEKLVFFWEYEGEEMFQLDVP